MGRTIGDILSNSNNKPKKISLVVYIVPGRMPALFTFVGGIRCIRFHPWFAQRVCARHRRQRAESQTIWPITMYS